MGSKGGGRAASPQAVVCCMCGDYGLSSELFRCKVCLYRSQHKYCSDLYPKAESYRACNWCLREEGGKSVTREYTTSDQNPNTSTNGGHSNGGSGSGVKLHRAAFSSHLNKPIKKQRLLERSSSDATDRVIRSEEPSKARQVFRGKVRRYKLLEEVSS